MSDTTVLILDSVDVRADRLLASAAPQCHLSRVATASVRQLPPADGLVAGALRDARIARATGFAGRIVALCDGADQATISAFGEQGTVIVPAGGDDASFTRALVAGLGMHTDGSIARGSPATVRLWRLIAAGEIACELQHAFNNPLTALMTEIQMLQLDAPNADTKAAAGRMLDLVRRLTELSRSLDGVRDRSFRV